MCITRKIPQYYIFTANILAEQWLLPRIQVRVGYKCGHNDDDGSMWEV